MPVSEETFKRVSLEDGDARWELHHGCLRAKPPMTYRHNEAAWILGNWLQAQLGFAEYVVRVDAGLVRRSPTQYYIPDVMVIPRAEVRRLFPNPDTWEVYADPLPLVVEVWSPSTGDYDVTDKLAEYQRRGDGEVWLLHPIRQSLHAWRRQADGTYSEAVHHGGTITPQSLPSVTIDLDELFRLLG